VDLLWNDKTSAHAPTSGDKCTAFISAPLWLSSPFFSIASLPTPVRARRWCCGVVSDDSFSSPDNFLSGPPHRICFNAAPHRPVGWDSERRASSSFVSPGLGGVDWICILSVLLPLHRLDFFFSVLRSSVPPLTTAR
jgi:hypothetical protein